MNTRPDSTRQRDRQATRPAGVAARRWAGLGRIHHYVLALPAGPLWDVEKTQGDTERVSPHPHTYWKKERGECGGLHLHILSPLPPIAVASSPSLVYCGPLDDKRGGVRGMMAYLSKPPPAELCRPGPLSPWALDSYARAKRYRAALEEYQAARVAALGEGRRRLRPMSGWVGRTRRRAPVASPVLVLAVLRFLLLLSLPIPAGRPVLSAPVLARCRPIPGRRTRPWCYTLPPPRGQAQAR
jgi:hypothetical protein